MNFINLVPWKLLITFSLGSLLSTSHALGQSEGGFPYNPDSDNSGSIEVNDLLVFLPYYGGSFLPEGVIPVAFGGTGSTSASEARDSLGLSFIKDTLLTGSSNVWTWADGSLRVLQQFAQGYNNTASGQYAHASGNNTSATGAFSHAQNRQNSATATCSSAQGEGTTASGTASHAEGMFSQSTALASHAEGYNTDAVSNYSHSEGYGTLAGSLSAHAEGYQSKALGLYSHAEGRETEAGGDNSHAEGKSAKSSGDLSHAEGLETIASGTVSHAGGYGTVASGMYSRASGRLTVASATTSVAFGNGTIADQESGLVLGQFNLAEQTNVLFAIGNGDSDSNRSNAFEVALDGTARVYGDAEITGDIFLNGENVGATLDSLYLTIAALEAAMELMQDQIDALTGGE